MSYSKIINPLTGRKVSIYGKLGKTILKNYLRVLRGGASGLRSSKTKILQIATPNMEGYTYHKRADTYSDLEETINKAEKSLKPDNIIIFKMVYPDNYYKSKTPRIPHQGHTFALARNDTQLIVYDNSHHDKYVGAERYLDNYKRVINTLKGERELIFFPTKDLTENPGEYNDIINKDEGSCQEFIYKLFEHKLLQTLPLKDVQFEDSYNQIWKFTAATNSIEREELPFVILPDGSTRI